jgi:regulator of cell morphogenesis and NO signaling
MTITEQTRVADIATTVPSSVRVFQRFGIDFCCGGKIPLGVVCQERGLAFAEVASAIEASSAARADERDWTTAPRGALIAHIVSTYHDVLREELPRLEAMATKVAAVHGAKGSFLARVRDIVAELSADLREHMQKEERVLFPAIRAIDEGGMRQQGWVAAPIAVMEREHDRAGELLSELRRLSGGYVTPEWACNTFRALYHGLAELEASMHVHVHLENNVLFPRALKQEEAAAATA